MKAIIFDMDGVITNTMPYHFRAWHSILRRAGVDVSRYDIYKREGQDGLTSVKEILEERGIKKPMDEQKTILAKKEALFKRIVKPRFVKGAREFIRLLRKKGVPLALVTGTSRHEMRRILPKELRDAFAFTITGDEVKKGKPHPEPFLKALKALRTKDAIVLENAPFGIESAKRAGLFCVALTTSLPRRYLSRADAVYSSYKGLKRSGMFPLT